MKYYLAHATGGQTLLRGSYQEGVMMSMDAVSELVSIAVNAVTTVTEGAGEALSGVGGVEAVAERIV
eukprot:CAMPEP_0198698570 /NCGR_PEP_ID=MMETSP1468-20131203/340092_1 /TAXON_ID=1461545 /ORGANISM="Mantoniella sp, Strain CCMP1436" /LENGTH=66 /DNA_ID=CAMNT_0044455691 /DNA_START=116 /DNA_END=313 /DNA_ORIENTATION=-